MVHAAFIQTLKTGQWKVLYSHFYGPGLSPEYGNEDAEISEYFINQNKEADDNCEASDIRRKRHEICKLVCTEVQKAYCDRVRAYKINDTEVLEAINLGKPVPYQWGYKTVMADERDRSGGFTVVWLGALNCAVSLVCDRSENLMALENILKLLVKYLQNYCYIWTKTQELIHIVDHVTTVFEVFLPMGQTLILNHRWVRQKEKELDAKLKLMA